MDSKIIQQGAEAVIKLVDGVIVKERIKKNYRFKDLDLRLRLRRTRGEEKIIDKLRGVIDVPLILDVDKFVIKMEYIDGLKLSDCLEKLDWIKICKKIGFMIGRMHNAGIVHGDLTTSNMIFVKNCDERIYFIDFGLGFYSNKVEDKAVDLHLLKQALNAKHYEIAEEGFEKVLEGYLNIGEEMDEMKKVVDRLKIVGGRGRYK